MQRSSATVIAVVGDQAQQALDALEGMRGMRVVKVDTTLTALERAATAQQQVTGGSAPIAVHDADPLTDVSENWVRLFDGHGARGELEIAVTAVLRRWRSGGIELPDYYLLLDADAWPQTRRHWYLGMLAGTAPARVLPVADTTAVADQLRRLPSGHWWPRLDRLLDRVARQAPDQLQTPEDSAPTLLTQERPDGASTRAGTT